MISFIGKVKRGEVVSSRLNDKVKEDWSSFQHRYAERAELSLLGTYPPPAPFTVNVRLVLEERSHIPGWPQPWLWGRFMLTKGCNVPCVLGVIAAKPAGRDTLMGKAQDPFWRKKKEKKKSWKIKLGIWNQETFLLLILVCSGGKRQLHVSLLTNVAALSH